MEAAWGEAAPRIKGHTAKRRRGTQQEHLKSAAPGVAKDYAEKASAVFDEAKERAHTFREDGEDYVRENPMKAVFTALGVGFVLGLIFRH